MDTDEEREKVRKNLLTLAKRQKRTDSDVEELKGLVHALFVISAMNLLTLGGVVATILYFALGYSPR